MGASRLGFGRNRARAAPTTSDTAVAAPPGWLLCAVIVASTAALFGSSPSEHGDDDSPSPDTSPSQPTTYTTYQFARTNIEGGTAELTRAAPSATFFVDLTATDLGPHGVVTTGGTTAAPAAHLQGSVAASDLTSGATPPFVAVVVSSPDDPTGNSTLQTASEIAQDQRLQFTGDCEDPSAGDCKARFVVRFTRNDDGAANGKVSVHFSFDVESSAQLPAATSSTLPAQDPPWSVEVTSE